MRGCDDEIKLAPYVVIAAEEHKDHTNSGRQKEQPVFCEDVRIQKTTSIADTDFILRFLVVSVERGQINVRGSLVDVYVVMGCAEDAVTCSQDLLSKLMVSISHL